jgi:hypothetical protein
MLGAAFGGLERMAFRRVAGKPFFCTEFDLNPPNDYNAETIPMLALLAAYQGWSGVAEYSWLNFQQAYGNDRMTHNFHTTGNAGQMATVPGSALIFRLGLVQAASREATLSIPAGAIPRMMADNQPWFDIAELWMRSGGAPEHAWRSRISVELAEGDGRPEARDLAAGTTGPLVTDTGEITFDRTRKGAERLVVNAPAVRVLIGRTAGETVAIGDVSIRVDQGFEGYANITLAAIDGKPVRESKKLLLTALARVENKGQVWNGGRTAVKWGEGPTVAEPVAFTLDLPQGRWRVRAMDGAGRANRTVPVRNGRFSTGPRYATLWYLVEKR